MKLNNNINFQSFKAKKMPYNTAKAIDDKLKSAKNVTIMCHEASDKDTANAAMVMWQYLNSQSQNAKVVLSQDLKALNLRKIDCPIVQSKDFDEENSDDNVLLCVDFSAKERMPENLLPYLENAKNWVCIDHHTGFDLKSTEEVEKNPELFYQDTSAKSTTGILYRYFEALGEKDYIDENVAYDLMSGFVSDCSKKKLVVCDGKKGTITPQEKLKEDKDAYEVFNNLYQKLSDEQIAQIAKDSDIISSLTPKEKAFREYVFNSAKVTNDGKIAYVAFSPNSKIWNEMGADNTRTSAILSNFRQEILKNPFDDEKFKNVKAAMVFYRADNIYRVSIHSKDENLIDFYEEAKSKMDENIDVPCFIGGHPTRGGGKILSLDEQDCREFMSNILSCSQNLH